jgi:hypothetical protein
MADKAHVGVPLRASRNPLSPSARKPIAGFPHSYQDIITTEFEASRLAEICWTIACLKREHASQLLWYTNASTNKINHTSENFCG